MIKRLLVCLLLAFTLDAAPVRHGCGTDGSMPERIAALDATARARDAVDRRIAANGDSSGVRRAGDVVLVEADELNAPFFHPFDLHGREVRFTRTSDSTYSSENAAATLDADFGMPLAIPQAAHHAPYTLPFAMPFFERTVTELHVTDYNALFLAAPQFPQAQQLGDLEAFASRQGVIAPMLTTDTVQFFEYPQVFVKTLADAVRFTWRRDGGWQYTVQATLHRDGTIVFAYDAPKAPYACAMLLTSGAEPVRGVIETIVVSSDAAGDASLPMLDVVEASMSRVADTNVLRFRLELAAPFTPGEAVAYTVWLDGVRGPALTFAADGSSLYSVPSWGITRGNPAARFDGSALELDVLQEQLPVSRVKPHVRVVTSRGGVEADEVSFDAELHKPKIEVAELEGPVIRTFTLPVVSVPQIWRQVQRAMHFDDTDFDAVAIYQNFWTDILFFANAYSSVGNAGVDGISRRTDIGSALPRTPALMHMNALQYTQQGGPPMQARQMLLHELGHRWLYFFDIMENGARSKVLAPLAGHPAQYVHTPAAFRLAGATDSSAMGGAFFTDNRNGTFTSARTRDNFGYSWHELYLMGLAAPEEVTPWFYIADSVPRLGPEYYPLPNRTFRGTRRDVRIEQVLDAMGSRFPAYPETQREFRVLYVLLTDPSREVTADELAFVTGLQHDLQHDFAMVTGGRASVVTSIEGPPRRRQRSAKSEE
jgi:hypothetical protein